MAERVVHVQVEGLPAFAAVLQAAIDVRDELVVRGDHGVSVEVEQRLIDALIEFGLVRYDQGEP